MKPISLTDLSKLKKMMAMTTSSQEGEQLNAIRMANKILKDNGLTWEDIFSRTVNVAQTIIMEEPVIETEDKSNAIQESFNYLRARQLGDFRKFITSLEEQWEDQAYLSKEQRVALFNAVRREQAREAI